MLVLYIQVLENARFRFHFRFRFRLPSPLIESTETETETRSPDLRIDLHHSIRFINIGSAITCFTRFLRPKNWNSFPFF